MTKFIHYKIRDDAASINFDASDAFSKFKIQISADLKIQKNEIISKTSTFMVNTVLISCIYNCSVNLLATLSTFLKRFRNLSNTRTINTPSHNVRSFPKTCVPSISRELCGSSLIGPGIICLQCAYDYDVKFRKYTFKTGQMTRTNQNDFFFHFSAFSAEAFERKMSIC